MKKIAFLFTHKSELIILKKLISENSNEKVLIIAWTPYAVDTLVEHKLPFVTPQHFCSLKRDSMRLVNGTIALKKACVDLDKILVETNPELNNEQTSFFSSNLARLRDFPFVFENEVRKISKIKNSKQVEKIFYSNRGIIPFLIEVILTMRSKEEYSDYLFCIEDNHDSFEFKTDAILPLTSKTKPFRALVKYLLGRSDHKSPLCFLSSFLRRDLFFNKKKNILVLDVTYVIAPILKHLKKEYNIIYWEDFFLKKTIKKESEFDKFKRDALKSSPFQVFSTRLGFNFSQVIINEFINVLKNDSQILSNTIYNLQKLNETFKFDAVITAYEQAKWQPIFSYCDLKKIPVLIYTHGGTIGLYENLPVVPLSFNDFKNQDNFLYITYTKYIQTYIESINSKLLNNNTQVSYAKLPNNEALLEKINSIQLNEPKEKVKICYVCFNLNYKAATTSKDGDGDPASLYDLRCSTVKNLASSNKISLSYKFGYYSEKLGYGLESDIINGKIDATAILSSTPFTKSLGEFDLYIFEFPSTPLYESISTKIPALLYMDDRVIGFEENPHKIIDSRITITTNRLQYTEAIEDLCINGWNSKVFQKTPFEDTKFKEMFLNTERTGIIESNLSVVSNFLNRDQNFKDM